jgi:hypothetical protein
MLMRTVVFQAGLKAGFCPALASSGPVCPGIALLLAHCLAVRPLPTANAIEVKPKPPEKCQNHLVDDFGPAW